MAAMDPFATALAGSPALFPHAFDPRSGTVTLIRLGRTDFTAASFLDDRVLRPGLASRTVPWRQIAEAAAPLSEKAHYIFHIGHVGSTLLSRLLGARPELLSLREPRILRDLAQNQCTQGEPGWDADLFAERLVTVVRLLSRGFGDDQIPLVKATSYVSELAAELLVRPYGPRGLLLHVAPETFLAAILGAEHSPQEAKALAPNRLKRLHRRLGMQRWNLEELSPGEIVALGWACEMTALGAAAAAAGDRAIWMDFDRFLAEPQAGLARAFAHLGVAAADDEIAAIVAGPEMHRYAKAPEHAYDAALREAVLQQGREMAADEIAKGLVWLERAAAEFPVIAAALAR